MTAFCEHAERGIHCLNMIRLPKISVIVPTFNHGSFLEQNLGSVFGQDYPRLEVVVIDGGSTDKTLEVIDRFSGQLTFWQSRPDKGQANAINQGAAHCSGDLIAWLNSDDFYWRDCLWTVARAYLHHPAHGLYIGNGFRFNQGEYWPFCERHLALDRDALIEGLDYILQPATFFLREAWESVGGLDEGLRYCMDWDIIIRIAQRYSAVLVNDFLAASREYPETKTASGGVQRAIEILNLTHTHSTSKMTPGALFYFCETLLGADPGSPVADLKPLCHEMMRVISSLFRRAWGNSDGFPQRSDSQDVTYLPFAADSNPRRPTGKCTHRLPSISVITPSYNQAQFLDQALASVWCQAHPGLEMIVIDGGSTDGSERVVREWGQRLAYWVSEPDRGPAHAINKGLAKATGEVIGWLNSDDLLAEGALQEVREAFADDPELDMVYANALYIDGGNQLFLADHGRYKTGLYYGRIQPREMVPMYWKYIHAVPQPTVFFRRRLLDKCGLLDESLHFIFDFELFSRFSRIAKVRKIERTLAFYRIHSAAKTAGWNDFEIELYRFSRPHWPPAGSGQFLPTLRDFTQHFMRRKCPQIAVGLRFYWVALWVALSAAVRIGNPEKWRFVARRGERAVAPTAPPNEGGSAWTSRCPASLGVAEESHRAKPQPALPLRSASPRYHSFFCSYLFPRHPGHSGGEIRDFHILRHLLGISSMEFYALYPQDGDPRGPSLEPLMDRQLAGSNAIADHWSLPGRAARWLRARNIPVFGMPYHADASERFPRIYSQVAGALRIGLEERRPDFLFVSPQSNPVAMTANLGRVRTRLIMASYDVECVRLRRLAASHTGLAGVALRAEARRAARFERDNLRLYDGVMAVSALDKQTFIRDYAFPDERVLVLDNGIDPAYFQFHERVAADRPEIVYTGSFTYAPNRQAARRLICNIMPAVWARHPRARLWVVGQSAGTALEAFADGDRIVVTGRVEDVRPYLAGATVGCIPLVSGSGTKYKVLEAMSAGVPLVCSPIATEGLDVRNGDHILIRETDSEIADSLVQLINSPDVAQLMAHRARDFVEARYAWDSFLMRLDGWLDFLALAPLYRATAVDGD